MTEIYKTLRRIKEPIYGHIQEGEIYTASLPQLYPTSATISELRIYFQNEPTILRQLEDYQFVTVTLTEGEPDGFDEAEIVTG